MNNMEQVEIHCGVPFISSPIFQLLMWNTAYVIEIIEIQFTYDVLAKYIVEMNATLRLEF